MAWEERDYYREPRGGGRVFGGGGPGGGGGFFIPKPPKGSVTFWLLIVNIAVFFLGAILYRVVGPVRVGTGNGAISGDPLSVWGFFSFDLAIRHFQLWRVLTFQFLHFGLWHLVGNMLGLFFFGHMAESYFGSKRFLAFYLLCGVSGAVAYVALWFAGLFVSSAYAPLMGASAGIFGILVVAAMTAPHAKVLLFFIIPIPLRVLVWGLLFIAGFVVISQGNDPGSNAGGQAAHLGGAAVGYLLFRHADWLNWADRIGGGGRFRRNVAGGASGGGVSGGTAKLREKLAAYQASQHEAEDAEVDQILDKVRRQGLQSLTRKEKKTLGRATQRKG